MRETILFSVFMTSYSMSRFAAWDANISNNWDILTAIDNQCSNGSIFASENSSVIRVFTPETSPDMVNNHRSLAR